MLTQDQECPIQKALAKAEQAEREYQNHPLWRELGIAPKEFNKWVETRVRELGVDAQVWEQKLNEAKQVLQTRINESKIKTANVTLNSRRFVRL